MRQVCDGHALLQLIICRVLLLLQKPFSKLGKGKAGHIFLMRQAPAHSRGSWMSAQVIYIN